MLNFKKFIASFTASALVLGSMGAVMASTNETKSKYSEAITTLGALGIMVGDKDTNEFRENDPIKRSEFAKVAIHALGLDNLAESQAGKTRFPDVSNDHWATGYINVATQQGIIKGDTEGTFRPDANISYAEAMTILVRVLGFEPSASSRGGYPGGYILVGNERGIAKGVSIKENAVDRGSVAQMTFNSLTTRLMEQTGFGSSADYTVVDKTLLADKLEVEKFTGKINATEHTALEGYSVSGKGKITIGDKVVETGGKDFSHLLGSHVKAYAEKSEDGSELTLILVLADEAKTESITLAADEIDTLTSSSLKYHKDGDKVSTTLDISASAQLIYNHKKDDMANLAIPSAGSVTLIENTGDKAYDIIMINESKNLVVEDTSAISYTITDKYGNASLVLDKDDKSLSFTLTDVTGADIEFEKLAEWDVISYTKSRDGKVIRATVCRDSIEGEVTEKNSEKVVIGGKDYKVAENYQSAISLGDKGAFMLDIYGKIAAVNKNVVFSDSYAYLMNAAVRGGVDSTLELQLFTTKGESAVLKAAKNLKIDSQGSLTPESALAILKGGGESVVPQLISFAKNADGEISLIERAVDKSGEAPSSFEGMFVKNAVLTNAVYNSKTNKLGSIALDEKTIVFDIPQGETDASKYAVRDYKMFADKAQYNASVFDLSEDMTAKVIIVTNSASAAAFDTPITVVERITEVNNSDGTRVFKIYAYSGGEKIELVTAESEDLIKSPGNKIETGDIIQYKTNLKGEAEDITVLFDTDNKTTEFERTLSQDVSLIYGKVTKKFAGSVNISVNGGAAENFKIGDAKIYRFDSTKTQRQITVVSASDIQKYDAAAPERVFMRLEGGVPADIVIIK